MQVMRASEVHLHYIVHRVRLDIYIYILLIVYTKPSYGSAIQKYNLDEIIHENYLATIFSNLFNEQRSASTI